jgi:hypothetical protein
VSRRYEELATLETPVTGDEADFLVRAHVAVEMSGYGSEARLDGDVEVRVDGRWVPADAAGFTADSIEYAREVLCDAALEDDSDYCREADRDDDR